MGNNVQAFWESVKTGKVGIGEITRFDTADFKVKLAAEVKDFNAKDYMDFKSAKRMELFSQYAVAAAKEACAKAVPEVRAFTGRVVSGDQFISDRAVKNRISQQFGGMCTEMEGAAIAQAAYLNKIPFVVLRAISDKADDSAVVDYPAFETTIRIYELLGAEVYLYFDLEGFDCTARVNARTTARPGDEVVMAMDLTKLHIFDKDTEMAIVH